MRNTVLSSRAVQSNEGPTYRVVNDLVTFKAVAADTGGAYSLFETRTEPGQGTPPHFQRDEEEAFYILEGSYTFLLGEEQIDARPGSFLFVPRGTVHAFTNTGETVARMLILTSPGGIHERFFAEAGELVVDRDAPAPGGPVDIPRLVAVAEKYGVIILPPPTN